MANAVTFKKVKVDHSGSCDGFTYLAGKPVELPEDVLKALGNGSYEVVAGENVVAPKEVDTVEPKAKEAGDAEKKPTGKPEGKEAK